VDQLALAGPLGQVGFFDQFTVTFSRGARQLAIESAEEFDRRWQ